MAINVNSEGGMGRRRFHGMAAMSEINVTPFVDVVLVLLIIFMMTAQVMNSDIQVDVPKTKLVREFLEQNRRVHFHFTPTYSSWLNQVELWFARIERDVIARGIFTSVSDLARKLRRYINAYSANARPFQWKYSDPTRRIRSNEFTATGH